MTPLVQPNDPGVGRDSGEAYRRAFYQAFAEGVISTNEILAFWQHLYDLHWAEIRLFCISLTRARARHISFDQSRALAEDCCSETFVKAYEWYLGHVGTRVSNQNERSWLHTIARNLIVGTVRDPDSHSLSLYDCEGALIEHAGPDRSPLEELINIELSEQLKSCLARLSDVRRRALTLVHLEGMTVSQAARELGISPNTLSKRLFDACKEVRNCLRVYVVAD